jgi:hypothetical protein
LAPSASYNAKIGPISQNQAKKNLAQDELNKYWRIRRRNWPPGFELLIVVPKLRASPRAFLSVVVARGPQPQPSPFAVTVSGYRGRSVSV